MVLLEDEWIPYAEQLIRSRDKSCQLLELERQFKSSVSKKQAEAKCTKTIEDELKSLKIELTALKTERSRQVAELKVVEAEEAESTSRLSEMKCAFDSVSNDLKKKKDALASLKQDVFLQINEKQRLVEKLIRDYNKYWKMYNEYKTNFGFEIKFNSPDLFKLTFSSNKEVSLVLRSIDFESWEVLQCGNEDLKVQLEQALIESRGIQTVLCLTNKMLVNGWEPMH